VDSQVSRQWGRVFVRFVSMRGAKNASVTRTSGNGTGSSGRNGLVAAPKVYRRVAIIRGF
jgi:hypothetical protein